MPCGQGALCTNTQGGYDCACPNGTVQNPERTRCNGMVTCTVVIETVPITCARLIHNLQYSQIINNYSKPAVFKLKICSFIPLLPPICADIDECEGDNHLCEHDCMNTVGSYTCFCSDSHTNADDGINCLGESFVPPPQSNGVPSTQPLLLA